MKCEEKRFAAGFTTFLRFFILTKWHWVSAFGMLAPVALKKSTAGTLLTSRKQKEKAMRRRLRGLIEELGRAMDPLDDRWIAFGLNKPGLQETPDRPTKVNVTLQGSSAAVK